MTEPRLDLHVWHRAAQQIEEAAEWWARNREGSPHALYEGRLAPRKHRIEILAFWHSRRGVPPNL